MGKVQKTNEEKIVKGVNVLNNVDKVESLEESKPKRFRRKTEGGYQTKQIIKAIEENDKIGTNQAKLDKAKLLKSMYNKNKYSLEQRECDIVKDSIINIKLKKDNPKKIGSLVVERDLFIKKIGETIGEVRFKLGHITKPIKRKEPKIEDIMVKRGKETGFNLNSPALIRAFELGILTNQNYSKIKTGGYVALESYTGYGSSSIGIKNCYSKLEEIMAEKNKKVVVVYPDNSELEKILKHKLEEFKKEEKKYYAYYNEEHLSQSVNG